MDNQVNLNPAHLEFLFEKSIYTYVYFITIRFHSKQTREPWPEGDLMFLQSY